MIQILKNLFFYQQTILKYWSGFLGWLLKLKFYFLSKHFVKFSLIIPDQRLISGVQLLIVLLCASPDRNDFNGYNDTWLRQEDINDFCIQYKIPNTSMCVCVAENMKALNFMKSTFVLIRLIKWWIFSWRSYLHLFDFISYFVF